VVLTELTNNIRQGRLRGKPHLKVEIHPEFALKYEIPIALAHKISNKCTLRWGKPMERRPNSKMKGGLE